MRGGERIERATILCFAILLGGCGSPATPTPQAVPNEKSPPTKLSLLGLFRGDMKEHKCVDGVLAYDLNTPLFSDYTHKKRYVKLPAGTYATYSPDDVFSFPVGTVIAKTFSYPVDAREPAKGERLIETRVLLHEPEGWVGLPYVWNESQTDATLEVAGGSFDATWIHHDGTTRKNNYVIPNANQCKGCHKRSDVMQPIGPTARQFNRDFAYESGTENQLAYWSRHKALTGLPEASSLPKLAVWNDPKSGSLDDRARAWLEINCAHCHRPDGPAKNSGLDLRTTQHDPVALGIFKTPVAAGPGAGGRSFDIVPGKPDESIMPFRIASTSSGIMMPELGNRMVHEEGVKLIRGWIAQMPEPRK